MPIEAVTSYVLYTLLCFRFFRFKNSKIMIKANELRIGNLINIKNKASGLEYKEEMAHGSLIMDLCSNGDYSSFIYSPIEITEELLLRLGFDSLGDYGYGIGKFHIVNRVGKWGFPIGSEIRFLKYTHEVQNLYFALTSKELVLSEA